MTLVDRGAFSLETLPRGLVVLDASGAVLAATGVGWGWLERPEVRAALPCWLLATRGGAAFTVVVDGARASVDVLLLTGDGAPRYLVAFADAPELARGPRAPLLSPRQREVCEFAAAGATVPEIARTTGVSRETVRTHLRTSYRRLGVANRVELARALERA